MSSLTRRQFLPSNKAAITAFVFGNAILVAHFAAVLPDSLLQTISWIGVFALFLTLLVDWLQARSQPRLVARRRLPTGLALNQWGESSLTVEHSFKTAVPVEVFDHWPEFVHVEHARMHIHLLPGKTATHRYHLRPLKRGPVNLQHCQVRVPSPFGFWKVQYLIPCVSHAKVYPDFSAVAAYTLLAADNHVSHLGIRRKNRRGQGLDFHQLRAYRQGDSLRQLDWKATARRQELVSKDYQDERDQNVVLMIDSGRRMRSKDGELDHFDYALNAGLLVSYIALRQGDSVGVFSFGSEERWIAPQKGNNRINTILNGLYDLQASKRAPDYLGAAEKLTKLQRKRSLIILITNTRDEEIDELLLALDLLRKRHIVLIANIREAALERVRLTPVSTFDQAMEYCGSVEFVQHKHKVLNLLHANGSIALDCQAAELPAKLANSYWDIKRAGAL